MRAFLERLFVGDLNKRYIKKLQPIIDQINGLESAYQALSAEQLKAKTVEFKAKLAKGATLDDLLPEAFAAVREAARRTLGQRHYDVQLIGGIALHRGEIAEMRTGEGKTLTATAPVYLNALEGKGVHVITVNDYLAKRDAEWMGQIYNALGLTTGVIQHAKSFIYTEGGDKKADEVRDQGVEVEMSFLKECSRRDAYAADITYGTNNEYGFDYLRDNMVQAAEQLSQRDLHYAIVDEVDSILIDEARTPLIISAPDMESTDKYFKFAAIVKTLIKDTDFNVDEKRKASTLTAAGIEKIEKQLGVDNIYVQESLSTLHHIEQALRAEALFRRDKDYVVRDGEVVIVDEFTGRLMEGRRYSQGLHQAIEAKEGVTVQRESKTLATITFQNYFRLYKKLSGMTGTAFTEATEFRKIYGLEVTVIPTNKDIARIDKTDRIYKNETGKFQAVVREIKERHEKGQPVLVGTVSIEKNELLSGLLNREGIPHNVLNAKNHEKEAMIIAQAGKPGAVTIATNMAGRGVDIILGGKPASAEDAKKVRDLGGLHVIGTERHESRRIDNQLRGRSGRQGDPGETQFYVSMEDDLMRIFGSDRMKNIMHRLGLPDDVAIENKMVTRSLEEAQKRVETHNFDQRKHVVEYDDVLNKQRTVIYAKRRELIKDTATKPEITRERMMDMLKQEIEEVCKFHLQKESEDSWNLKEVYEVVSTIFPLTEEQKLSADKVHALKAPADMEEVTSAGKLAAYLFDLGQKVYADVEKQVETTVGDTKVFRHIEKQMMLRSTDTLWINHLETMDNLRNSIGLRGYGQRDPLVEYKRESFRLFNMLLAEIRKQVIYNVFKVRAELKEAPAPIPQNVTLSAPAKEAVRGQRTDEAAAVQEKSSGGMDFKNVGRNDLCPCGSGKKFKKCHGA